jgi:hypothetical protein
MEVDAFDIGQMHGQSAEVTRADGNLPHIGVSQQPLIDLLSSVEVSPGRENNWNQITAVETAVSSLNFSWKLCGRMLFLHNSPVWGR